MIEFKELQVYEQVEALSKAVRWAIKFKSHVDALIKSAQRPIAPSGSDIFHPELWKSMHWLWFKGEIKQRNIKLE